MRRATVGEIAEALNVTGRRVQQLVVAGMPKAERGRYDLVQCLSWMVRHQQHLIARRESETSVHSGDALRITRARLVEARTADAEISLAARRGELIPLSVYTENLGEMIRVCRQQLLQLPARIAPSLEGENRAVIRVKLTHAVHDALAALAEGGHDTSDVDGTAQGTIPAHGEAAPEHPNGRG